MPRGRPKKYDDPQQQKEAKGSKIKTRKQRQTQQRQRAHRAEEEQKLIIEFDPHSILESETGTTRCNTTAPGLGIQADGLAIPADENLQNDLDHTLELQDIEVSREL